MRLRVLPDPYVTRQPTNVLRQTYWTLTTGNDAGLMSEMAAIYQDEVEKIKDAPGIVPSAIFPPISTDMTKLMSKNGGNPLGLAGQGPLNCIFVPLIRGHALHCF